MTDLERIELALRRALATAEGSKNAWLAIEILLQEISLMNIERLKPIAETANAH